MKVKLLLILALTLSVPMLFMVPKARAAIPGDIDGDGDVGITDVTMAAGQYMLMPGDPGYDPAIVAMADIAEPFDGVINLMDMVTIVSHYTGELFP